MPIRGIVRILPIARAAAARLSCAEPGSLAGSGRHPALKVTGLFNPKGDKDATSSTSGNHRCDPLPTPGFLHSRACQGQSPPPEPAGNQGTQPARGGGTRIVPRSGLTLRCFR